MLNEINVVKNSWSFDQDDIDYLEQFPPSVWTQALYKRYNQFLIHAIDSSGNLKSDWSDTQNVVISKTGKGSRTFDNIDTKVSHLVQKMKDLGYNLQDFDTATKTSVGLKLPD